MSGTKETSLLEHEVRAYWRASIKLRAKIRAGGTLFDCCELMDDLDLLADATKNEGLRKMAHGAMLVVPLPAAANTVVAL